MTTEPILHLQALQKWFPLRRTLRDVLARRQPWLRAVDTIGFALQAGETLGLVGESGCGKTTTGKLVMRLLEPTQGRIVYQGRDVMHLKAGALKAYRRQGQMIFQDPYTSMNPRFRVRDVLEEPLLIHRAGATRRARYAVIRQALEQVRLLPADDFMARFPHTLSGGQRQRVATARTLVLRPNIIVADEPVSMIDLSTRAEILHLLKTIQQELGLTYLYITHDLSTARYFTDRLAVMYLGRIVEIGSSETVISHPAHPYTRALIAAVCEPVAGRVATLKTLPIQGEIPSAAAVPAGCRFHPRCPAALPRCRTAEPPLVTLGPGHQAACHLLDR